MRKKCVTVFFWFVGMFVFTYGSFGQIVTERTKYQRSTRELWGRISDTTRLGAVPLAHVFLMDRKDTVKLVADLSGRFYYNGRLADTMQVQVTALGFKPFIGQYIPKKHGLDICVQLQQEDMMLDEVIITGKRLMMVVKGDTLKYNVDEVKTLEGAKMGEILEKLPGVSMDGGLKVNGVPIHRIYVNGDTLFKGTDALDYIAADNVKDVKVFDERNKEDLAQGLRHGRREKVMDVTTKREVTRQEIARTVFEQKRNVLTIGGGVDASRDRTSKFPEKFLMTYTYNKGRVSSSGVPRLIPEIRRVQDGLFFSVDYSNLFLDDKREFGGKFVYAKKFRGISYNSQYVYRNTTSYRNQWEELDYFPTDRFDSRRYEQTSSEKNMVYKYATSQTFVFPIREINFQLSGLWTYDVNKHWKNNMMLSKLDNEIMNCANLQDYNRAYTSEGGAMLVVSTNSKKKNTFVLSSGLNFTQGGRRGWQRDTLEISNRQVYLDRDWDNNDVSWNSNFKFNSVISPLFKLVVTGNYKYSENSSRGFGENMLTGSLDTNNTRNYTFYHNSYKIDGGLIYYGERVEMKGGVAVNHQIRNQVERFSVRRQMKDRFFYVNPMWSMRVTFSPTCNMALSYSTKTKLPLLEQLRIEVDEANPLNLSVGNPDLKPTNKHTFRVECNKILPPSSALRTLIYFALIQKPIVSSSRYFMETTYLPKYAYIVEQGATLNTFENSDSGYNLLVKAGYEKFWSFLGKCTFDISYEQLKRPSFIQEESCDLMTNRGTCEIGINTNFSEKVKLSMTSNTIFDSSDSRLGRGNKLLSEGIELNVETMIIPKYLVKATMKYDYCKNFTTHYEMKETILNVEISHKFKYFLMALKGENLLDSKRSNSAGSTEQYDYRRGWSQSGRYVTLIVSKRF